MVYEIVKLYVFVYNYAYVTLLHFGNFHSQVAAGFNPKVLNWINKSLKQNIISSPPPEYRFDPSHEPDQWFKPTRVLKIICTTLTLSPVWKAAVGLVDREKGICVHLPCFVWSYNDKKPEEATTASQVADMYHRFQCQAISESDEEDVDII